MPRPDDPRGNDYAAWCLDEFIYSFGSWVESVVHEAIEEAKDRKQAKRIAEATLKACLTEENETAKVSKGQFKDPLAALNGN